MRVWPSTFLSLSSGLFVICVYYSISLPRTLILYQNDSISFSYGDALIHNLKEELISKKTDFLWETFRFSYYPKPFLNSSMAMNHSNHLEFIQALKQFQTEWKIVIKMEQEVEISCSKCVRLGGWSCLKKQDGVK